MPNVRCEFYHLVEITAELESIFGQRKNALLLSVIVYAERMKKLECRTKVMSRGAPVKRIIKSLKRIVVVGETKKGWQPKNLETFKIEVATLKQRRSVKRHAEAMLHEEIEAFKCDRAEVTGRLYKKLSTHKASNYIEFAAATDPYLSEVKKQNAFMHQSNSLSSKKSLSLLCSSNSNKDTMPPRPRSTPSNKAHVRSLLKLQEPMSANSHSCEVHHWRLRKEKEEAQQRKFLENLKQLHINLPFIEALAQMSKYAKFLKSLLTNKARLKEACIATMNERCSAVLLNKLSSKEKNPGSFTIPCNIGHLHINNVLADLGASISLMPYTMYEKLGLGEPKPSRMSLELADRSIQYPMEIIENVLIKVDKFVLSIDLLS
ncbi:reverse transcriptase domain-containing protein [Tanacetum coccineum]